MSELCYNRLAVLGSKVQVQRFQASQWDRRLCARHCELLENSPSRLGFQFETECPPARPAQEVIPALASVNVSARLRDGGATNQGLGQGQGRPTGTQGA